MDIEENNIKINNIIYKKQNKEIIKKNSNFQISPLFPNFIDFSKCFYKQFCNYEVDYMVTKDE